MDRMIVGLVFYGLCGVTHLKKKSETLASFIVDMLLTKLNLFIVDKVG